MLATGFDVIREAHRAGHAVAAITTYTLESIRAVVSAAERTGRPVILQAGSSSFGAVGRDTLAAACLAAAQRASVPVGVHLDHADDRAEITACIELGYSSVMVDGSGLPFEENVALTRAVAEEAHSRQVWVEGELGALPGNEDASSDVVARDTALMTDPAQAEEFVDRTGVDALAVAVGNVHGISDTPARLDLARLEAIAARVRVPLVLHGASGLPVEDLTAAVARGVAKVNVNAELRRAHIEAVTAAVPSVGDDVRALQQRSIAAMSAVAGGVISLLAGASVHQRHL
jgi:tagatose 1,6-diphosphate aldolase GatY/KbaY